MTERTPEQTAEELKLPPNNQSVEPDAISDEDLKHLVIHYATIIRNPNKRDSATVNQIIDTWGTWPKEFKERFYKLVWDEADKVRENNAKPFWCRPADNNIRYGV